MRKGKEFYNKVYNLAIQMHKKGLGEKEISEKLKISYSTVYAWLVKDRKPEKGALIKFRNLLEKNGPTSAGELKEKIPKHNDFYHISGKRGFGIKRIHIKGLRLGQYAYWYYLDGQEKLLKKRVDELIKKYREVRKKFTETIKF